MNLEQEKDSAENMSALEEKVDTLLRYCVADSAQLRRRYQLELLALLGAHARNEMASQIDGILLDLGIPDHLLGYGYLRSAISKVVQDPELAHCVTGALYPAVARQFGTTGQLVERAIRHAVESGWSRCQESMRQRYFGGKIRPGKQKPTNAEFIARVANIIRN